MEAMSHRVIAAHTLAVAYVAGWVDGIVERARRDDRGQASVEYAGIMFVVVAIIAAVIAAGFTDVGTAIKNKIVSAVNQLGS